MSKALQAPPSWVFEHVRPKVPSFIDRRALDCCSALAATLPGSFTSFYMECRLDGDPQLDYLAYTRAKGVGGEDHGGWPLGANSHLWQRNLGLLREWITPASDLSDAPCVWLEYDDVASANHVSEPSLSVGLQPQYYQYHDRSDVAFDPRQAQRLASATLRHLVAHTSLVSRERVCRSIIDALPRFGAVGYISVMTTRNPVSVKLYVKLPRQDVVAFLRAIEWPGSAAGLNDVLGQYYAPFRETAFLDLTLADRVEARLGLATSQFHRRELGSRARALQWLSLPRKLDVSKTLLACWPGVTECELDGKRIWIRRWLDTKAVIEDDGVNYKAYLGFMAVHDPPFLNTSSVRT